MSDGMRLTLVLAIIGVGVVVLLLVAQAPGRIARSRGHASSEAILICGLFGLIFPPLWFAALIWAYTGPDNSAQQKTAVGSAARVVPQATPRAQSLNYPD